MTLRSLLLLASVAMNVLAQLPNVPHGGGPCKTDWDCSLGGVCEQNACSCDVWFTGPACDLLNLAPAEADFGMQLPTYYSWGGRAAPQEQAGSYQAFFSFMCKHATLDSWTTKSASVRATAATPVGPFSFTEMIVHPWSHNTFIARDDHAGKWLLWHIGDGTVDPHEWSPCFSDDEKVALYEIIKP
jgi:hypothetical protein